MMGLRTRAFGGMRIGRGNKSICRRLVPVLFRPLQIPYKRTWNWTLAATVAVGVQCCDYGVTRIILGRKMSSSRSLAHFFSSSECVYNWCTVDRFRPHPATLITFLPFSQIRTQVSLFWFHLCRQTICSSTCRRFFLAVYNSRQA
jgi:hypothetical protein